MIKKFPGLAQYSLTDSCTADADLAEYGLTWYSLPGSSVVSMGNRNANSDNTHDSSPPVARPLLTHATTSANCLY